MGFFTVLLFIILGEDILTGYFSKSIVKSVDVCCLATGLSCDEAETESWWKSVWFIRYLTNLDCTPDQRKKWSSRSASGQKWKKWKLQNPVSCEKSRLTPNTLFVVFRDSVCFGKFRLVAWTGRYRGGSRIWSGGGGGDFHFGIFAKFWEWNCFLSKVGWELFGVGMSCHAGKKGRVRLDSQGRGVLQSVALRDAAGWRSALMLVSSRIFVYKSNQTWLHHHLGGGGKTNSSCFHEINTTWLLCPSGKATNFSCFCEINTTYKLLYPKANKLNENMVKFTSLCTHG